MTNQSELLKALEDQIDDMLTMGHTRAKQELLKLIATQERVAWMNGFDVATQQATDKASQAYCLAPFSKTDSQCHAYHVKLARAHL